MGCTAESEAAQESDRIQASYFTHYLISGLRGAADVSGEGKVTLNEAYQFTFNETLGRTVETKGGAQHPSYDINLSGTGEVVMTDLRQTSAMLVLGAELDGRFFVRNAKRELVVELYKRFGRKVELGVEPGGYEVHLEREAAAFVASGSPAHVIQAFELLGSWPVCSSCRPRSPSCHRCCSMLGIQALGPRASFDRFGTHLRELPDQEPSRQSRSRARGMGRV